jgi:DNA-directed RNA polymerase specialized sigma subunit
VAVQSPIQVYRSAIGKQPKCTDPWMAEVLSRSRSGDEDALREISGRCLTHVLDTVERRFPNRDEEELLDIVQDANAALLRAIKSFPGTSADQFLAHLDRELGQELDAIVVDG